MITTKNEDGFIAVLRDIQSANVKLLFGQMVGNRIVPDAEIRVMPTLGGMQYGIADINYANQRCNSAYTRDYEEAYIRAIDIERRSPSKRWYTTANIEHTIDTEY